MIKIKIDIVSDDDNSQKRTMDTICITKTGRGSYMVYGGDRSNVCSVKDFKKSDGELDLIRQALQSLIKSGDYCYFNIIPERLEKYCL